MLQLMCSRDGATYKYNAMTVFDNNISIKMLIRPDGDLEKCKAILMVDFLTKNLKENIIDFGSQWHDVKALRVRKYNFIVETCYAARD